MKNNYCLMKKKGVPLTLIDYTHGYVQNFRNNEYFDLNQCQMIKKLNA